MNTLSWVLAVCLAALAGAALHDYSNAVFDYRSRRTHSFPAALQAQARRADPALSRHLESQLDVLKAGAAAEAVKQVQHNDGASTCASDLCNIVFGRPLNAEESAEAAEALSVLAISKAAFDVEGVNGDLASLGAVRTEKNAALAAHCPRLDSGLLCVASRFRHADGRCNNVEHPWWGSAGAPLRRALAPAFGDGLGEPSQDAPNPGLVSAVFAEQDYEEDEKRVSLLFTAWAHFVADDVIELTHWKKGSSCLNCKSGSLHSECLDFLGNDVDCASSYSRLVSGVSANCRLGPQSPANLATSFLDGSALYGSTAGAQRAMRRGSHGLLKSRRLDSAEFPSEHPEAKCAGNRPCYRLGNNRGNYLPTTAALVTMWLREHNRLAREFAKLNNHWDDERLYQEARRLVEAQIQHITYNEYLPLLIGQRNVFKYGLTLSPLYSSDYTGGAGAEVVGDAAATVGFRFQESMLSSRLRDPAESNVFFFPEASRGQEAHSRVWQKMLHASPRKVGLHLSTDFDSEVLGKRLPNGGNIGGALLLQVTRDAGTQSYVRWRQACNLPVPETFEDLITHSQVRVKDYLKIKDAYERVGDVELLVGALAEESEEGGVVGATLACILADLFQNLKRGDRFWYENYIYPSALSKDQLAEVKKSTLARVICANAAAGSVQPSAFQPPDGFENSALVCAHGALGSLELGAWADPEPVPDQPLSRALVEKALMLGQQSVQALEKELREKANEGPAGTHSSSFFHTSLSRPNHQARRVARISNVLLEATRLFFDYSEDLGSPPKEIPQERLQELLPQIDVSEVLSLMSESECHSRTWPCDHSSPFRTQDGWCNNLRFPEFGISGRRFRRLLPPVYDDIDGSPLPGARAISNAVHSLPRPNHVRFTHFIMQWGQFVDHDTTLSPISLDVNDDPLACESCDSGASVNLNCFPIPIPADDPHFPPRNEDGSPKCLHFARSIVGQLRLGYREQLNQLTAAIDASNVYGSDDCVTRSIRAFEGGRLATQRAGGILPANPSFHDCRSTSTHLCFLAGDERVNEHAGLGGIHTISLREHNRVVDELAALNPHWDDERLFQEGRRIMGALFQHITFTEWLPKVVGRHNLHRFGIQPQKTGFFTGYDDNCDMAISNVFATAIFRFGHTLVQGQLMMMSDGQAREQQQDLVDLFFNTSLVYEKGKMKELLMGFSRQPCAAFDATLTDELRNRLFEEKDKPHSGLDLAALNIQRGRDHGLPSYTEFRKLLHLKPVRNWEELRPLMDKAVFGRLKDVYKWVEDIDMFPGAMSETRLPGAVVGETIAAVLGEQFGRLRKCDRFWYENGGQAGSFTAEQLNEIRRTKLSSLICQNMGDVEMQADLFGLVDDGANAAVPCRYIPSLDLSYWKEFKEGCDIGNTWVGIGGALEVSPCVSCTCTSDGVRCHSFRVGSCRRLLAEKSAAAVLGDAACVVQCHALLSKPSHRRRLRRRQHNY